MAFWPTKINSNPMPVTFLETKGPFIKYEWGGALFLKNREEISGPPPSKVEKE